MPLEDDLLEFSKYMRLHSDINFIPKDSSKEDEFWSSLFFHFFTLPGNGTAISNCQDDLVFFVEKCDNDCHMKPNVRVFRRYSQNIPKICDKHINSKETFYLNLVLQNFKYVVTLGVCTRSGQQEIEILKKFSQVVYASPSYRPMQSKGHCEEIVYPYIVFSIDNFENAFFGCSIRDTEYLCIELAAYDQRDEFKGVVFECVLRYATLNDACSSHPFLQYLSPWIPGSYRSGPLLNQTHLRMYIAHYDGTVGLSVISSQNTNCRETSTDLEPRTTSITSLKDAPFNEQPSGKCIAFGKRIGRLKSVSVSVDASPTRDDDSFLFKCSTTGKNHAPCSPTTLKNEKFSSLHSSFTSKTDSLIRTQTSLPSSRQMVFYSRPDSVIQKIMTQRTGLIIEKNHRVKRVHLNCLRKARSDIGCLNRSFATSFYDLENMPEIEGSTFENEFKDVLSDDSDLILTEYYSFWQLWHWFTKRRRIASKEFGVSATFISIPISHIISGLYCNCKNPVLTLPSIENTLLNKIHL